MPRRRRSLAGLALRLLGYLVGRILAAIIVAGGERWNRTGLVLLLLAFQGCSAAAPKPRVVPVHQPQKVCQPAECVAAVK